MPPPLPPPYRFSVAARKHETLHTHPINPALGGESSRGEEGPRKVGGTEGGGGMIGVEGLEREWVGGSLARSSHARFPARGQSIPLSCFRGG